MATFKHIDFEIADWGEFSQGPVTAGVGAAISQSQSARFPDRPSGGGGGMRITMTAGTGASYLEHDLGTGQNLLYVRFLLNIDDVSGGAATVVRGLDPSGVETFYISYDAAGRTVSVVLATGQSLSVVIPGGMRAAIPWHCVEIKIDAAGGQAGLWLNGVPAGAAAGSLSALNTRRLRVGVSAKGSATLGTMDIDEIVIADAYVGPVLVSPRSDYADAPERWLVVFNSANPDSAAWAASYRAARGTPFANLLGLPLDAVEEIDATAYLALRSAVHDYLVANRLDAQVLGILLGYGVPGYVDLAGFAERSPICSMLYDVIGAPGVNQQFIDGPPVRPSRVNLDGLLLTARMDAPNLTAAQAMITRAVDLETNGVSDGGAGRIWLDPYTEPGPLTDPLVANMVAWSAGIDRARTRLPLQMSAGADPHGEAQFTSIQNDGFFWGWAEATPPPGFFASPAGSRVFCIQLETVTPTAPTLREADPSNWVSTALAAGYAAAGGSSAAISLSALPSIHPFFEALRLGWTLAEAWWVACPLPGQALFLTGDPLLKTPFPRAGWELFGPLNRLEELDLAAPALIARENESDAALPTPPRPAEGVPAYFVIRHTDDRGRDDGGVTSLQTTTVSGLAMIPPLAPVWPDAENWPVWIENSLARLSILWEKPMRSARVRSIELQAEIDGGSAQTLQTLSPNLASAGVVLEQPLPALSARFRWRIIRAGDAAVFTPWSAVIYPAATPSAALQLLEGSP